MTVRWIILNLPFAVLVTVVLAAFRKVQCSLRSMRGCIELLDLGKEHPGKDPLLPLSLDLGKEDLGNEPVFPDPLDSDTEDLRIGPVLADFSDSGRERAGKGPGFAYPSDLGMDPLLADLSDEDSGKDSEFQRSHRRMLSYNHFSELELVPADFLNLGKENLCKADSGKAPFLGDLFGLGKESLEPALADLLDLGKEGPDKGLVLDLSKLVVADLWSFGKGG
eukprot:TRINITY_DN1599_c1_g1_i1.p2 TRINITY_DN1599_c1_g1~~TRINITY_DN1599_c1_g1_i1.p2  ORF type:complete len:222 (+),score=40.52 TRINITY_DN1599_c1_g1_i1:139-804(+)